MTSPSKPSRRNPPDRETLADWIVHAVGLACGVVGGLGQILDTVPNHMAVVGNENVWWNDILENGPASPYANYFDIAWSSASRPELLGRVLIPVLGEPFAKVLETLVRQRMATRMALRRLPAEGVSDLLAAMSGGMTAPPSLAVRAAPSTLAPLPFPASSSSPMACSAVISISSPWPARNTGPPPSTF